MLNLKIKSIGQFLGGDIESGFKIRVSKLYRDFFYIGGFCILDDESEIILCSILNVEVMFPDGYNFSNNQTFNAYLELVNDEAFYYVVKIGILFSIKNNILSAAFNAPSHNSVAKNIDENIMKKFWSDKFKNDININIGNFISTNVSVTLPLKLFFSRCNGVFGKTGTGKTFITRTLICYALYHKIASFLIFDMHSEYASNVVNEKNSERTLGLKELFYNEIIVVTIGNKENSSNLNLSIPLELISIDDILALQQELSLHTTACEAAYLMFKRYGEKWLISLLEREKDLPILAREVGAHPESISALHRKIKRIESLSFITTDGFENNNSIKRVLELLENGKSIIIEFSGASNTLSYLLVSTIFTRLISQRLSKRKKSYTDKPCVIVIEEAHKFLHPSIAHQTPFGMVAREMRKYGLSLLIVDQRPSQIDNEILSQIATKFLLNITDESDRQAILCGVENSTYIKKLFNSMENNSNLIITGYAVPFSCLIKTIHYDNKFCAQFIEKKINISESVLFD